MRGLKGALFDGLWTLVVVGILALLLYLKAFGLVAGLAAGLLTGLAAGLLAGLCGDGYVWLRYAIAVRAAARLDWLPKRPSLFLDWCVHTGLMRMAGSSLQFRHRQLQDWLISSAERAAQAESRARQRLAAARH